MKGSVALLARLSPAAAPLVALLLVHCSDLKSAPASAGAEGEAGADLDAGGGNDASDLPETGFSRRPRKAAKNRPAARPRS